jgi:hypothetical protein
MMIRTHARCARLLAALAVLATVATLVTACGSFSRDLEPGTYRAVIELAGGELPFGLDVAKEENGVVLYLVNGEDRVRVTEVTAADGHLTATLPGDGNTLTAEIRGGKLTGEVSLPGVGGERQVLPLRADSGETWRFFEEPSTDNADVAGRWAVIFTGDRGEQSQGIAQFTQSFERVTGTIVASTGDAGLLAGEVRGDELFLSRFDGSSAHLYRAKVDAEGRLVGEHWSVGNVHQSFRAEREPEK